MKKLLILLASIALFLPGCDKIKEPFKNTVINNGDIEETTRRVLLEEYTGHTCVNCPAAARLAADLKVLYGERLILLSIHAGSLAAPSFPPFDTDYRSEAGNTWDAYFSVSASGVPLGMVNRISTGGILFSPPGTWPSRVAEAMEAESVATIAITSSYDELRKLDIQVETKFISQVNGNFKLQVLIVEDNIIGAQRNNDPTIGPPTLPDYVHRHVLRAAMNGAWGENLLEGGANPVVGTIYTKNYSTTLNEAWNDENISVIAFVYDDNTKEVLQVTEIPIGKEKLVSQMGKWLPDGRDSVE